MNSFFYNQNYLYIFYNNFIIILKGENTIPTLLFRNLPDTYSSNELYNLCNGFGPIEAYKYEPLCNIGSITYKLANKNGRIPRNALLSLTGSLVKNKRIKVEFDRDGNINIDYFFFLIRINNNRKF